MALVYRKMYTHGDKDSNYDIGEDLGMDDDALQRFKYNLYEVEFLVEIDTDTGGSRIIEVDGIKVQEKSPPQDENDKEKDDYLKRLGVGR